MAERDSQGQTGKYSVEVMPGGQGYSWDRARIDTTEGAKIWTSHGVLAHNLIKISSLAG